MYLIIEKSIIFFILLTTNERHPNVRYNLSESTNIKTL